MTWRRKPRTINEELLAQHSREAEDPGPRQRRPAKLRRWILVAAVVLAIELARFLPSWVGLIVGALVVGHYLRVFLRSTRQRRPSAARIARVILLIWFAICVATTLLVAVGGFEKDDRALLGIVWPVLGLIWVFYRLRAARLRARPGTGSPAR
jgi:hypothetical protein